MVALSRTHASPVCDSHNTAIPLARGQNGDIPGMDPRTAVAVGAAAFEAVKDPARPPAPPNCYYAMRPAPNANANASDAGDTYTGKDLQGTRAYERLVHMTRTHPSLGPERKPGDTPESIVDAMVFDRRTTILLAPCHDGHTCADRKVPVNAKSTDAAMPPPARRKRASGHGGVTSSIWHASRPNPDRARPSRDDDMAASRSWRRALDLASMLHGGIVGALAFMADVLTSGPGSTDTGVQPPGATMTQGDLPREDVATYERELTASALSSI
ncbi:hypothetical protein CAL13_09590 [Bordetella genomosp. 9]|uniref:Uncharacterized protein n=2 Tax=Bordetella genomosp. 9 TaxID=1416803 RepID=A0A1W6Z0Q1_9BORD|nr:hypothetical protein CAL13_09590 [Bordetella genomosp. 9]